ncbi:MAG: M1 family aminopeptidase [Nitriliruptorales bacterium]|nr:M1 family aminopeptidase [Nitriliruptorales bacterium]
MDSPDQVIIEGDGAPTWHVRLIGVLAVALLVAATLFVALNDREDRDQPTGEATPSASPTPKPSPTPPPGLEVLDSPGAAARAGAETVLAVANRDLAESQLGGGWPIEGERPVYVVNVTVRGERDFLLADQVIALRIDEPTDRLDLRFLPAAAALGTEPPFVAGSVDGEPATITMDPVGAVLRIDLGAGREAGEALLVRLSYRYTLARASTLGGDGPVGYGLLSRDESVTVLSHWLPLLTFDASPLQARGDLGAFPPAIWSVEVVHPGVLVTGGVEDDCRVPVDNCTKASGVGLRDLGMLVLDEADVLAGRAGQHEVRVIHGPAVPAADVRAVLAETIAAVELFNELFGPLAWPQTDVVGTPLSRGAAGMEYPGMFILRDDLWRSHDGAFGTYVIAHEVAHQWFHGLVGNSSLADPVVDEAIAQYLSVVFYAEQYGEQAATDLADSMIQRWQDGLASGMRDDPPAQALAAFESDRAYGAIVYGRAPFAFIEAERVLGREVVIGFLAELVRRHALDAITVTDVVTLAGEIDEGLMGSINEWWIWPDPSL